MHARVYTGNLGPPRRSAAISKIIGLLEALHPEANEPTGIQNRHSLWREAASLESAAELGLAAGGQARPLRPRTPRSRRSGTGFM